jgi:hypothetical protein
VSHAGWINAALWQQDRGVVEPTAAAWPAPLRYGAGVFLSNDCASSSSPLDSKSAATAATWCMESCHVSDCVQCSADGAHRPRVSGLARVAFLSTISE